MLRIATPLLIALLLVAPASQASFTEVPDYEEIEHLLPRQHLNQELLPAIDGLPKMFDHDASKWLPLLLQNGFAYTAATYEYNESLQHYVAPLGDADDDGRDDIILFTYDSEEETVTMQAISAGEPDDLIWEIVRDFDDDDFYYIAGDFNEDEVLDLVRGEEDGDGESIEYTALDGRDLSELFTVDGDIVENYSGSGSFLEPTEPQSGEFYFAIPLLADLWDEEGGMLLTLHIYFEMINEGPIGLGGSEFNIRLGTEIDQLDMTGTSVWTGGSDTYMLIDIGPDLNGDGLEDLLFGEYDVSYRYGGTLENLEEMVGGSEPEEQEPMRFALFNTGENGTAWEIEAQTSSASAYFVGNPFDDNETVAVNSEYFYYECAIYYGCTYDFATYVDFVNANDGSTIASHSWDDAFVYVAPHGDITGNGLDELLQVYYAFSGGGELRAVTGELVELWDLPANDIDAVTDMNGDEIRDIIKRDGNEMEVINGVTGKDSYLLGVPGVNLFALIDDVDLDDGAEILTVVFDDEGERSGVDNGILHLYAGADGANIWTTKIWDANYYNEGQRAKEVGAYGYTIGDLTGDGAQELVVYLFDLEHDRDDSYDEISLQLVLNGATTEEILRFDYLEQNTTFEGSTQVTLGPAGEVLQNRLDEQNSPGAAFALLAIAMLAIAFVARRKA